MTPDMGGQPMPPPVSDRDVIAAIRGELWEALRGRDLGGDRSLVGMVKRLRAELDDARNNRLSVYAIPQSRLRATLD